LGSGYIGLEFGQMFSRFGSKVTILEPSDRILKKEDKLILPKKSRSILALENIEILTSSKAVKFEQKSGQGFSDH
jgi:pyruvate/2-oxoglutarate dehydrogenase complex dihydrolipoamide dehydrogenase (E3) component